MLIGNFKNRCSAFCFFPITNYKFQIQNVQLLFASVTLPGRNGSLALAGGITAG